jgi:hypothetical protein
MADIVFFALGAGAFALFGLVRGAAAQGLTTMAPHPCSMPPPPSG